MLQPMAHPVSPKHTPSFTNIVSHFLFYSLPKISSHSSPFQPIQCKSFLKYLMMKEDLNPPLFSNNPFFLFPLSHSTFHSQLPFCLILGQNLLTFATWNYQELYPVIQSCPTTKMHVVCMMNTVIQACIKNKTGAAFDMRYPILQLSLKIQPTSSNYDLDPWKLVQKRRHGHHHRRLIVSLILFHQL